MSDETLSGKAAVDEYFLKTRKHLIDAAAGIDRMQRLGGGDDYRFMELRKAVGALLIDTPERAAGVLSALSDPTERPTDAPIIPKAVGAYNPSFAAGKDDK